jgi:hypothetical protein
MKVDKPECKKTIFDIEVVTKKEAYAPIAGKLAAFNGCECRDELLAKLRGGYERGPKSDPFDPEKCWLDLTRLAEMYFWWEVRKKETTPPAECFKRLRRLVRALYRAHRLAAGALQEDIGHDLLKAWFGGTIYPRCA